MQLITTDLQARQARASNTGKSALTLPLDPKVADELLRLLATDNGFRRRFKHNPTAALKELGHGAGAGLQACSPIEAIATKREIADSSRELKSRLTTVAALTNPHCFEAGEVISSLRRISPL